MQTKPDSQIALTCVEGVRDALDAASSDGEISAEEIGMLKQLLAGAEIAANVADTARALGVCVARGGVGGDRYVQLSNDYRRLKWETA